MICLCGIHLSNFSILSISARWGDIVCLLAPNHNGNLNVINDGSNSRVIFNSSFLKYYFRRARGTFVRSMLQLHNYVNPIDTVCYVVIWKQNTSIMIHEAVDLRKNPYFIFRWISKLSIHNQHSSQLKKFTLILKFIDYLHL